MIEPVKEEDENVSDGEKASMPFIDREKPDVERSAASAGGNNEPRSLSSSGGGGGNDPASGSGSNKPDHGSADAES